MHPLFDLLRPGRALTMQLKFAAAALLLAAGGSPAFAAASFEGDWKVPGDKPGEASATVTVQRNGERYRAVVKEFRAEAGKPDPVCHAKCPPGKRGHPVAGLEVIWDLRPEGNALVEGYLLDPTEGMLVRCQLRLSNDGQTLLVKMYQGLPLFGATEEWKR